MWNKFLSVFSLKTESVSKITKIYPNPVSKISRIDFYLTEKQYISLKIYDLYGKVIMMLAGGEYDTGNHTVEANMEKCDGGIYLVVLQTKSIQNTRKIIVIK